MSVFDISGSSNKRKWWNHTNPQNEEFSTTITGDVVEITAVPRYIWNSQSIDRWPDGNPKIDMIITLLCTDGQERCFRVKFNTSKNEDYWPNIQRALFAAMRSAGLPGGSLSELGGLNITVATKQPPEGFGYGPKNPRPYHCQVNGKAGAAFRGCIDKSQEVDGTAGKPQLDPPVMTVENPGQAKLAETLTRAAEAMGFQAPVLQEVDPASVYDQDIPF